ncbi:hypothetical protein HDU97_008064 [Phlyctochytrium planicorne]|nr:hypothetical protein HDU97_008064 [Phlyctochytrium planicorne]
MRKERFPPSWPSSIRYLEANEWPSDVSLDLQTTYKPLIPDPMLSTLARVHFDHDEPSDDEEEDRTIERPPKVIMASNHLDLPVLDVRNVPPDEILKRVEIRQISDPKHPAFGELGLFVPNVDESKPAYPWRPCQCETNVLGASKMGIPKHAHILDYCGIVRPDHLADPDSDYLLHLAGPLSVDADSAGNEGRCVNDFRGVPVEGGALAMGPNACFDSYVDKESGEVRVGLFALRWIEPGEEILVTYGNAYWKSRGLYIGNGFRDWNDGWEK